ncbi:hypothetical protein TRFO_12372 [Tritrichomonas foetus]|uniref:UBR-type domain-containing protein n=1 Tax=Tritrichomonas foetus TaxID=1144522 RepID=A0A1J4L2U5_9EUKA|nr:hypothetical protein TRFO_12372 [Tritrichomonas foetus]|eukprot:OHT17416.1 hypothetical protein TRFO_12372 [Tritrichomonas foetus]
MSEEEILLFQALDYLRSDDQKDHEAAFKILLQCSRKGNKDATLMVGNMYMKGDGVEKNIDEGLGILSGLAYSGHSQALFAIGLYNYLGLFIPKDYETAFNTLMMASGQGEVESNLYIGNMYELGQGTTVNFQAAINYYEKAHQTNKTAHFYLARLLLNMNNPRGRDLMMSLANKKYAPACHELGLLYYEGKFVDKDYQKSKEYFSIAAQKGIITSSYFMGVLYEYGLSVEKDVQKAVEYYFAPSSLGNYDSHQRLKNLAPDLQIPVLSDSCTFEFTKTKPCRQHIFACKTCGLFDTRGICVACARNCHKGHDVIDIGVVTDFYCSCCDNREGCILHKQ